jgi:hypothetical protein
VSVPRWEGSRTDEEKRRATAGLWPATSGLLVLAPPPARAVLSVWKLVVTAATQGKLSQGLEGLPLPFHPITSLS